MNYFILFDIEYQAELISRWEQLKNLISKCEREVLIQFANITDSLYGGDAWQKLNSIFYIFHPEDPSSIYSKIHKIVPQYIVDFFDEIYHDLFDIEDSINKNKLN
jgi:hypothetical protein